MQHAHQPIHLSQIRITDGFWSGWHQKLLDATLPQQLEQLKGRLENFHRVIRSEKGTFEGRFFFDDSDVFKWLEATAYALQGQNANHPLRGEFDRIVGLLKQAQDPTGYLNTYFQLQQPPEMRFRNLHVMHEMYCGGHLIEAGVAAFECLQDRTLLEIGIRYADLIDSIFGPEKRPGYCGHEELELALVRLTAATGDKRYRELARWMVESRGHHPSPFLAEFADEPAKSMFWRDTDRIWMKDGAYSGEYGQDHAPIRDHTEIVGHAVRAMYLYMAATDLCEDEPLRDALVRIWNNLVEKRIYITGGLGPSAHNEGFTTDYDLPNLSAYAETCAAVGLVMWGSRLLNLTGDSEFGDVLERALYNGAISGISLDGKSYFYGNPLESRGNHARTPWFECACCPPNLARLIGSIGRYLVSIGPDALTVVVPAGMEVSARFGGVPVTVRIEGNYPWSGKFKITVDSGKPVTFALRLRLPGWADEMSVEIPGEEQGAEYENGFAVMNRTWQPGDTVECDFEMPARWEEANPSVLDNLGRVALMRGPLVYAFEEPDLGYKPQHFVADTDADTLEDKLSRVLGEGVALRVEGIREIDQDFPGLYAEFGATASEPADAVAIPYFAWANRGKSHMQVWVRRL
ncbi:MAG: glycoside hydrolase family 127 protein [Fimbriimonas sp.]